MPEALQVIRDTCAGKNARLFEVGRDVCFQKETGNSFNISGILRKYRDLHTPLQGDHQLINAATAVGALEILRFHDFTISPEDVRAGLEKVKWPARVEVISQNPTIILDTAHNAASAKALRDAIESNFSYEKLIVIIGISLHKDLKGMGRHLCPIADEVILTRVDSPRAVEPEDMKAELTGICKDMIITQDIASALEKAKSVSGTRDLICITGSVYLAGEVMQLLGKAPNGDTA